MGSVFDRTTRGLYLDELAASEPVRETPAGPGPGCTRGTPGGLLTLKCSGESNFDRGELVSGCVFALLALDLLLNSPHTRGVFDFGVVSSAESCASADVPADLGDMTVASCGRHMVSGGACDGLPSAIPMAMNPVSPCLPRESVVVDEPRRTDSASASASALPGCHPLE
jgi:hypothetical protein